MRKGLTFSLLVIFLFSSAVFAGEKVDKSKWVSIIGVYAGDAVVTNDKGFVMETPITLQIRKGEKGKYIIEMIYFKDKVAKITKCHRIDQYKVSISDRVQSDGKNIYVTGALKSKDGKIWSGGIRYVHVVSDTQKVPLRSFKFDNLKLAK